MLSERMNRTLIPPTYPLEWQKVVAGWRDQVAKLERVARLAKDLDHPDYPEYDWPSGSTEYEARRRRLREALADLPEDALGG